MNSQHIRTFLRTNPVTGGLVTWGFRHYAAAVFASAPDECSHIPKVEEAGKVFRAGSDSSDGDLQVMHNGLKVRLDAYYGPLNTGNITRFLGHHEPQEEKVFHEVLKALPDDMCMIEAGSYWGYYSMWAKKEKRHARNILIEPLDEHMSVGRNNFELNGLRGEFIRAYVGKSSEPPHSKRLEGLTLEGIERLSIDDLVEREEIEFVHIIHADIQGAERDLLEGSLRSIRGSKVGYFFISTHGDRLHAGCRDFLEGCGFVIVADHNRTQSFSTDGLIVARAGSYPGLDHVEISKNSATNKLRAVIRYLLGKNGVARMGPLDDARGMAAKSI